CCIALYYLPYPLPSLRSACPYTTLFRSYEEEAPHRGHRDDSDQNNGDDSPDNFQRIVARHLFGLRSARPAAETDDRDQQQPYDQDRKSTRLNSSHVKISYAVFCLKQKTL